MPVSVRVLVIFQQLSIFRGGFTREAAQAVVGANLRQLSRLANKSFLRFDRASRRYQIHELLRQYGAEKLADSGELETVRDAHNDYFLNFIQQREADIKGRRQLPALQEIQTDFENIRFAWFRAARRKNYQGIDKAIEGLILYFIANQLWADAVEFQQQALSALAPEPGQSYHPVWHHVAARHMRPRDKEIPLLREALALARQQKDQSETAFCLRMLGWASVMTGDFENGISILEAATAIYRTLADPFNLPLNLGVIANAYAKVGQTKQAYAMVQECITLFQKIGDKAFSARFGLHVSVLNFLLGNFEVSEKDFIEVASQYRWLGQIRYAAIVHMGAVNTAILRGQFTEAFTLFQEQASIIGQIDDPLIYVYQEIEGWLANLGGEYGKARKILKSFQAAMPTPWTHPFPYWMAIWGEAIAAYGLGDYNSCRQGLYEAFTLATNRQERGSTMLTLPVVALLLAKAKNPIRAVELLALAFQELAGWTGWLEKWELFTQLRADLEEACGVTVFAQAWQRGQGLDLWQTAVSLLPELTELDWEK